MDMEKKKEIRRLLTCKKRKFDRITSASSFFQMYSIHLSKIQLHPRIQRASTKRILKNPSNDVIYIINLSLVFSYLLIQGSSSQMYSIHLSNIELNPRIQRASTKRILKNPSNDARHNIFGFIVIQVEFLVIY